MHTNKKYVQKKGRRNKNEEEEVNVLDKKSLILQCGIHLERHNIAILQTP